MPDKPKSPWVSGSPPVLAGDAAMGLCAPPASRAETAAIDGTRNTTAHIITCNGAVGSDTLLGGDGNNPLDGGAGADIWTAALGDNLLMSTPNIVCRRRCGRGGAGTDAVDASVPSLCRPTSRT